MKPLSRIDAVPLFAAVQEELVDLLGGLSEAEWRAPTGSASWDVKDVVAHLLDGDVRRLSLHRDGFTLASAPDPEGGYDGLVAYLNELNETWIAAARRMSPRLLRELTAFLAPLVVEHLRSLDPRGRARFAVAWAGESESEHWFDVAREYTEKWHHQQQIREATGRPLLTGREWVRPLVATLVRAVPAVFQRHAPAAAGARVTLAVTGAVDRRWLLVEESGTWALYEPEADSEGEGAASETTGREAGSEPSDTRITMDDDTAWRLFTGRITGPEAYGRMDVSGDPEAGRLLARTVAYMK